MKRRRIVVCMLLLILSLIIIYKAPAQAQTSKEILKIGIIAPLSGPGQPWGEVLLFPFEMMAAEINAKGGLKVGNKVYEIKAIPYDSKYTGEGGLAATTRLVYEDKVKFIMGPVSSSVIVAIQPVTEKEKILLLSNTYTSKALSPSKPFTFRAIPTSNEFSGPQIAWIGKKYPRLKTVVVCAPNDETGREVAGHDVAGYKKAGIKVQAVEYYERGTLDMAPLVTRVLGMKPDALESDGSAPGDVANLFKTARAMGYKGQFIRTGGAATEAIIAAAGQAAEGMLYHEDSDIEGATGELADFFARLRKWKPGRPVTSLAPLYHTAFQLFFSALQKAGTVEDTNAVRLALEQIKEFNGLVGKVKWTGKETYGINHQLTGKAYIGQVTGGKGKVIAEIELK